MPRSFIWSIHHWYHYWLARDYFSTRNILKIRSEDRKNWETIINQRWLFVGISHPTKKNPDPGDVKIPGIFAQMFGIPVPGIFEKCPGSRGSRKSQKSRQFFSHILPVFCFFFSKWQTLFAELLRPSEIQKPYFKIRL